MRSRSPSSSSAHHRVARGFVPRLTQRSLSAPASPGLAHRDDGWRGRCAAPGARRLSARSMMTLSTAPQADAEIERRGADHRTQEPARHRALRPCGAAAGASRAVMQRQIARLSSVQPPYNSWKVQLRIGAGVDERTSEVFARLIDSGDAGGGGTRDTSRPRHVSASDARRCRDLGFRYPARRAPAPSGS